MNEAIIPLDGLNRTVTRPVVYSVINRLKSVLRLDDDIKILLKSTIDSIQQIDSSIDKKTSNVGKATKLILAEYTETYSTEYYGSTPTYQLNYNPVLLDKRINFSISPVYVNSDIEIKITYSDSSKNRISKFINDYRLKISQSMSANLHSLKYKYVLPDSIVNLLLEIHSLEEKQDGYGYNLQDYLSNNSSGSLELVSDTVGKNLEIASNENQVRIVGILTLEPSPENIEYNDEYYSTSFTYKITYQKPISVRAIYPTVVHNQLINKDFVIEEDFNEGMNDYYAERNPTNKSLRDFEMPFSKWISGTNSVLTIPPFDKWDAPEPIKFTANIMNVLAIVDPNNNQFLFNLTDLGDIEFDNDILNWLKAGEYQYATTLLASMFLITAYKDNGKIPFTEKLSLSPTLDITSLTPLDIRGVYHVSISLVIDGGSLDDSAVNRLIKNRPVLIKLLDAINVIIDSPKLISNRKYTNTDIINSLTNQELYKYIKVLSSDWRQYSSGTKRIQINKILTIRS